MATADLYHYWCRCRAAAFLAEVGPGFIAQAAGAHELVAVGESDDAPGPSRGGLASASAAPRAALARTRAV